MQLVGFAMAVWHVQENGIHFSGLHQIVGLGTLFSRSGKGVCRSRTVFDVAVLFFSMNFL